MILFSQKEVESRFQKGIDGINYSKVIMIEKI